MSNKGMIKHIMLQTTLEQARLCALMNQISPCTDLKDSQPNCRVTYIKQILCLHVSYMNKTKGNLTQKGEFQA